jgi:L-alanine-DL-glutamate epimerase-like enolase superfamily enzyme
MAKIKSVERFRVKPRWLFVKITDDEGRVGWGEVGRDLFYPDCMKARY